MKIRGNKPIDAKTLRRDEIIRGYNAYSKILQSSILVSTDFLKALINLQIPEKSLSEIKKGDPSLSESPLTIKVGFIVAKKKIRKAVLRNRIKRLLRESYRLNKKIFCTIKDMNIIFTLTEDGYILFRDYPKTGIEIIKQEMVNLGDKIFKRINK